MNIQSVSPQIHTIFQGLGGSQGLKGDLSAKGLADLAQGGVGAAEVFTKDLGSILKQKNIDLGAMPQIQPQALGPAKSSLEGLQKMGKHFLDTVNTSLVTAQKQQEKIITGDSETIQQSIISIHEANAFLSIFINFGTKCQEFYRAVMQTQV